MNKRMPAIVKFYSEGEMARKPEIQDQFNTRFVEAWEKIPIADRQAIERYLDENGNQLEVQLRDSHHKFRQGPSKDAVAQYIHSVATDQLLFKSSTIGKLTDRSCRCLIAHELAHLFLHIRDHNHGAYKDAAEYEVSELLLKRWGYERACEENLNVELHLLHLDLEGKRENNNLGL